MKSVRQTAADVFDELAEKQNVITPSFDDFYRTLLKELKKDGRSFARGAARTYYLNIMNGAWSNNRATTYTPSTSGLFMFEFAEMLKGLIRFIFYASLIIVPVVVFPILLIIVPLILIVMWAHD